MSLRYSFFDEAFHVWTSFGLGFAWKTNWNEDFRLRDYPSPRQWLESEQEFLSFFPSFFTNRWKQSPPQSKECAPSCLRQMFNIMLSVLILSASKHLKTIHEKIAELLIHIIRIQALRRWKINISSLPFSLPLSQCFMYISFRIFRSNTPTSIYAAECCLGWMFHEKTGGYCTA